MDTDGQKTCVCALFPRALDSQPMGPFDENAGEADETEKAIALERSAGLAGQGVVLIQRMEFRERYA